MRLIPWSSPWWHGRTVGTCASIPRRGYRCRCHSPDSDVLLVGGGRNGDGVAWHGQGGSGGRRRGGVRPSAHDLVEPDQHVPEWLLQQPAGEGTDLVLHRP